MKVSKEQVIEIERYCDEHGITRFIPIMSGSGLMRAASMPVGKLRRKHASVQTELMTIEVRTSSGAEMRLTGSFSTLLVVECRRKFRIRHLLHFAKGAYHHAHNFDSGEVHRFTEMDVNYTG